MKYSLSFLIVLSLLAPFTLEAEERPQPPVDNEKQSLEDVIPVTVGNMRGHKMLYNEGWYIVTSSSKALAYAKEKSLIASKTALQRIASGASKHTAEYKDAVKGGVRDSVETGQTLVTGGTDLSKDILAATNTAAQAELAYAEDRFKKAMEAFVRGNMTIAKRTEDDRRELTSVPGNYYKTLREDFSNLSDLTARARKRFAGKIEPAWEASFRKAGSEFRTEYEKSGTQPNSLMALGPILYGWLKSFYYGLAAPASKTIVKTTVAGTTYAVFLPVSATVVAGRTIQSAGLTVYYAGKTGVKIISPTVEGGLLTGLSLLSLGSVPVTYAAGGTLGAINQVAFSAAGPTAAVAEGVGSTAAHSAVYAGFLAYDAVKGTTEVVINQAASGIVLGYNALSALPAHALMGTVDTAVFLAYDGPRLVIAVAKGRVKAGKDQPVQETYSIGDLPIGTVVDLKELKKTEGVDVQVLSTDSAVIKNVLEKIPDDVRAE